MNTYIYTALKNARTATHQQLDKVGTVNDTVASTWDDESSWMDESASFFARRGAAYNDYIREINIYNAGHSRDDIAHPIQPNVTVDAQRTVIPPDPSIECHGGCGVMSFKQYAIVIAATGRIISPDSGEALSDGIPTRNEIINVLSHKTQCTDKINAGSARNATLENCPFHYYQCVNENTCPNAENHRIKGDCGHIYHLDDSDKHKVINKQCPETHTYTSGFEVQCQIVYVYACDPTHSKHNYPSVISQGDIAPPPSTTPVSTTDTTCGYNSTWQADGCSNSYDSNTPGDHETIMWCNPCGIYFKKCYPGTCVNGDGHSTAYGIELPSGVDLTPNCTDCTDRSPHCTNASIH